jgi:hypothetical protein
MILKSICNKQNFMTWTAYIWPCMQRKEHQCSVKAEDLFTE